MQKTFPVSVLIDYTATPGNRWQRGRWHVAGLVAGVQGGGGIRHRRLRPAGADRQTLWTGFDVTLHRDDAESYYFNLLGDTPRIFVICSPDPQLGLRPLSVTLSYDEAASYMEGEEIVEALAMPAALYRRVESFVLEHYVPEKRKKRKRETWKDSARERATRH